VGVFLLLLFIQSGLWSEGLRQILSRAFLICSIAGIELGEAVMSIG